MELAPEGTGYRARTRFSKFFNLPELMNLFKEVADIKTADQLNLPTPFAEGGTAFLRRTFLRFFFLAVSLFFACPYRII